MKIAVVNGPNMNLIGLREIQFYGKVTWKKIEERLRCLRSEFLISKCICPMFLTIHRTGRGLERIFL